MAEYRELEIITDQVYEENEVFEVEDESEVNFVMVQHDVIDSLIFEDIYEKMVYITIKRFANFNTKEGRPGIKLVSKLCCCSDRKVQMAIKGLEAKSLLKVTRRKKGNVNLPNKYTILKLPKALKEQHYKKVKEREEMERDTLVNDMHHPGAQDAPPLVHDMHHPPAQHAPERKRIKRERDIRERVKEKESIYQEEIKKLELPSLTKKVLNDSIDRLILFNVKLLEVEILFANTELEDSAFSSVLYTVLHSDIKKSFKRKMETSVQTYIENANKKQKLASKNRKNVREEVVPEYLEKEVLAGKQEAAVTTEQNDLEAEKLALQEKWKAYKNEGHKGDEM